MFDKSKFTKIGEEIYLYENFANKDECSLILEETNKIKDDQWRQFTDTGRAVSSVRVYSTLLIRERIRPFVDKDYNLGKSLLVQRLLPGAFGAPHVDSGDFKEIIKANSLYEEGSDFELKENSYYGIVFYFNRFEGGNLFYPNQELEYTPKPGDLIIHSSFEIARHGISKVTAGTRYSYANHIYNNVKVPKGYFDGN